MKSTKPKPSPTKLPLREPAQPLVQPETRPLRPDHPAAEIYRQALAQPAIAPHTIVEPAIAPRESELSHDAIVEQPAIAPPAIAPDAYTAIPNGILDDLLRTLHVYDQIVLIRLFRLSRGHHRDTCKVGYGTLAKACNMSTRQAQVSVERLIARGIIRRVGHDQSASRREDRGSIYEMLLPAAQVRRAIAQGAIASRAIAGRADNKERSEKKDRKGDSAAPRTNPPECPDCQGTGHPMKEGKRDMAAWCPHEALRGGE